MVVSNIIISILECSFGSYQILSNFRKTYLVLVKRSYILNCAFINVENLFKHNSTMCVKFALRCAYSRLTRGGRSVRWISKNKINELLKLKLQELMKLVKHKNH